MTESRTAPLTAFDRVRFTEGDCHFLARAIHLRTGWPIHCFTEYDEPDLHAFVVMPDGRALDVQGVCAISTMRERWKARRHQAFTWPEIRACWPAPEFGHSTYRRARVVAERLLAEVGPA